MIIGVAPAWAVDASGRRVPTRFQLDGDTLIQVVEHASGEFNYPIVADPWLGGNLFQWITRNNANNNVSMSLSLWGHTVRYGAAQGGGIGAVAAGQAIFYNAGWSELANNQSVVTTKATYRQQYDCHVLGAYYPKGGPTWDLESSRGSRPNWLNDGGAFTYSCNWP